MEIDVGLGKQAGFLLTEAERAELVEAPADDTVVIGLDACRVMLGEGGHVTAAFPETGPCIPLKRGAAALVVAAALRPQRSSSVGEVQVAAGGPDVVDGIFYLVFPNPADARADFAGPGQASTS
jgi:hypothetical protein